MSIAAFHRVCLCSLPLAAVLASVTLAGQQTRDVPRAPIGTGEISGVLSSADTPPQPVRRAVVTISGDTLADARSVVTDDAGRFVFRQLPAGTFSVTARKVAYLEAKYGALRPGRLGSPIVLTAGEQRTIGFTMFKGGAISGVLRNPDGTPLAEMPVVAVEIKSGQSVSALFQTEVFTTDDRGAYRIYGLMPGEYVVIATPTYDGPGVPGAMPAGGMDAVLSNLTRRQSQPGLSAASPDTIPSPTRPVNFAPIYFPGTAYYPEAAPIRLQPGEERDGVSFEVAHVPVVTIEGTVTGLSKLSSTELSIVIPGPRLPRVPGLRGITSKPPNERGEFSYLNVPPGQYRIIARARLPEPASNTPLPPAAARGGGGGLGAVVPGRYNGPGAPYTGEQLFGVADADVRGQDVKGVIVQLEPGGTLAGKVTFDAAAAPIPRDLSAIRVGLSQIGPGDYASVAGTLAGTTISSMYPININPDGTFRIPGVGPAAYTLSVVLPTDLRSAWRLRSAMVDGRDLLDGVIEGPSINLDKVVVTLTDRRTELSGTLQSASGQPAVEYFILAFSQDPRHWRVGSRRSQSTRPATNGRFVFSDLPAGEYFLAALTDLEIPAWQDGSFLEQAAKLAIRLTVAEGLKTVQDVRIR
jgi:hypothetical protein